MRQLRRLLACLLLVVAVTALAPLHALAAGPTSRPGRLPVILIPGIGGSELYNRNELVWINRWRLLGSHLPVLNLFHMNWLMPLRLAADGLSPYNPADAIRVGDIMRDGTTDAYSGLVNSLQKQGYESGKDLRLFAYDWRADLSATADRLSGVVDQTLRETGARQVVLIGHSQGGIIARDYVVHGGAAKVKANIAIGTPWAGAPLAYKALEHGWDFGLQLPGTRWAALAPHDVKILVQNFPAVYGLVPSRRYFDFYPEGYLTRNGQALGYGDSQAKGIRSHNGALADREAGYLDGLLDGSAHGVRQYLIAGKGRSTAAGFTEWRDWIGMRHRSERSVDGDEVVPLRSADLGYHESPERAQKALGAIAGVRYVNDKHTFLAQSPEVQAQVSTWLAALNAN